MRTHFMGYPFFLLRFLLKTHLGVTLRTYFIEMPSEVALKGLPLSTAGSFQSDFLLFLHDALNCPGTSHGIARRTCERGKRKMRPGEENIYFLHEWFINGTRKLIVFSAE